MKITLSLLQMTAFFLLPLSSFALELQPKNISYSSASVVYREKAPSIRELLQHSHQAVQNATGSFQQVSDYAPLFEKSCMNPGANQRMAVEQNLDSEKVIFYCQSRNSNNEKGTLEENMFSVTLSDPQNISDFQYLSTSLDDSSLYNNAPTVNDDSITVADVAKKTVAVAIATLVAKEAAQKIWPDEPCKILHAYAGVWVASAVVVLDKYFLGASDSTAIRDGIIAAFLANAAKKYRDRKTREEGEYDSNETRKDILAGTLGGLIGAIGIEYQFVLKRF